MIDLESIVAAMCCEGERTVHLWRKSEMYESKNERNRPILPFTKTWKRFAFNIAIGSGHGTEPI